MSKELIDRARAAQSEAANGAFIRELADEIERQRALLVVGLAEFNATMGKIGGCSDGGCRINLPEGMHTNGGCKCYSNNVKMQRYINATQALLTKLNEELP